MKQFINFLLFIFIKRITFKPIIRNELERIDKQKYRSLGKDPVFHLRSFWLKYYQGWATFKVLIRAEKEINAKLYVNYGIGYSEEMAIKLIRVTADTYVAEFVINDKLSGLRLDPCEEELEFEIQAPTLELHNEVFYLIKQFLFVSVADYKNNKKALRIFKKSFARYKKHGRIGMFERLDKEYRAYYNEHPVSPLSKQRLINNSNDMNDFSAEIIESLISIQRSLNNKVNITSADMAIKETLLPQLISEFRNNYNKDSFKCSIFYQNKDLLRSDKKIETLVDVIIPIYKDIEITKNCIESVLAAQNKTPYHLVLINDKSPDPSMSEMLNQYTGYSNVSVIENLENLGFIGTVNKGMRLNDRDVVLLNSDTITTDRWLDKLHKTAYSEQNIATVTPLSNSATILSYPETLIDNELPEGLTAHTINAICGKVNAGLIVDLPTAHGFCMFIKRKTLFDIGLFNKEKFGQGYAEENDFCMRAASKGWRNVASCDTFVQHIGSVSFAEDKDEYIAKNLSILNNLYPEYISFVNKFIDKDPLRVARRNISKEVFKAVKSQYMLFISHNLGGGTKVAADALAQLLMEEGKEVLVLKCIDNKYQLKSYHYTFRLEYLASEWDILVEDLVDLGIWHIHYHHIIDFKWHILLLPDLLNVEYDYSIHDYLVICPRINLMDEKDEYCNEPDIDGCINCLQKNGVNLYLESKFKAIDSDIVKWRDRSFTFLQKARRIYAPNRDVIERMTHYFSLNNIVLKEHPEPIKTIDLKMKRGRDERVKIAIIGAISYVKGLNRLHQCIKDAHSNKLPIDFIIIGFTVNDELLKKYSNVTITGQYVAEELPRLIQQHACSMALFLNVWPETFSYTFSESLENGLYPIAYDIGAIANRIKEMGLGKVLPLDTLASEVNRCIIETSLKINRKEVIIGKEYKNILESYYDLSIKE